MSKLPSGYTKLAYIQSTGTQYVDTGIKPDQTYTLEVKYQTAQTSAGGIAVSDQNWQSNGFGIWCNAVAFGNQTSQDVTLYGADPIEAVLNQSGLIVNGEQAWAPAAATFTAAANMTICALNRNGSISEKLTGKIYYVRLLSNGQAVRDFVPCIDPSGAVGLYDLVGQQFYGNAGTGTFTAGPEMAQPPAAPGNFRQTAKDYFSMSLALDGVSDAAGYKLYRDGTLLATLSETGYTDTGLQPNTAYTYTVAGINAEGEGDPATLTAKTKEGFAVEPNLITDRTQEDVLSLLSVIARIESGTGTAEDASLIKQTGNKGAYNFTDLNRVGAAVSYISRIITGTGYASAVSPKTDWMESDKPTEAQLNQYLADVETLRNGMVGILNSYAAESAYPLPEVPTDMLGLTYQEANDIETILLHIYKQIRYMSDHMYWVHSNDVYSGEV